MDGVEFLEYLELQGNTDMVTKSELLEAARARGVRISGRQLTTWITEGLVPKSARIGSRSGAFPAIVIEVVDFVASARNRGLAVESVRELLPVYRFLYQSARAQRLDLSELQLIARNHIRRPDAIFSLPWVVQWVLPCPACDQEGVSELNIVFKDGSEHCANEPQPLALGFLVKSDDAEECKTVAWMRVDFTAVDAEDPSAIVLTLPPIGGDADEHASVSQGSAKIESRSTAGEN